MRREAVAALHLLLALRLSLGDDDLPAGGGESTRASLSNEESIERAVGVECLLHPSSEGCDTSEQCKAALVEAEDRDGGLFASASENEENYKIK